MKKTRNIYITPFFILILFKPLFSQYLPKDGAKLNYNQIFFEYPLNPNAVSYQIHLAIDSSQNKEDFDTFSIKTKPSKTIKTKIEGLTFGVKYKWFVEQTLKDKKTIKSSIHYFSLYTCPYADTTKYKFRQHYNDKAHIEDGIIWLDHMHCAINRKLEVVWFIPALNDDFKETAQIRDFRIYKDGTITFVTEGEAYHITKDLDIIWKGPNDGKISGLKKENYHHSFEWLPNGNYMVLGNQYIELEKMDIKDTSSRHVEFTTLIEYNKNKDIVWSWKLIDHLQLDLLANPETNYIYDTHCNSFSISGDGTKVLMGFRDISRIIEIDKKSGSVLMSLGKKLNSTDTLVYETDLFRFPHDTKYIDDKTISVLNNNDVKNGKISSLLFIKLPSRTNKKPSVIWDFKFNFDENSNGKSSKLGNYCLLPNKNLLINQGSVNRIVEIDPLKKIPLWDLIIYKNYGNSGWNDFAIYRLYFTKIL